MKRWMTVVRRRILGAAVLWLWAGWLQGVCAPSAWAGQPAHDGHVQLPADDAQAGHQAVRTVVDGRGRPVALPAEIRRIVSLSPSLTESVCVLGRCHYLVAVDNFSNWPDSVKKLPHLGDMNAINIESVLQLNPDLVLAAWDGPVVERLTRLGVPVLVLAPVHHVDIEQTLMLLAQVLAVPSQRAESVWLAINHQLHDLAESLPAASRGLRVWMEIDPTPWLAGPASFLGETMMRLGLGNVVSAGSAPFVRMSPEWVFQADPQLLVISDPLQRGMAGLQARPGWQHLSALRRGSVCLLHGAALDTLVRPGPRLAEGARALRDCVLGAASGSPRAGAP